MVTLFGQWNDHDLTFTPFSPSIKSFSNGINCDESCEQTEPCIPIPVGVEAETQTSRCSFDWNILSITISLSSSENRSLLATPASPLAQTSASLPSDLPLFAGRDTQPTTSVEIPTRESRSTPWQPILISARCTALRTSLLWIFATSQMITACCVWIKSSETMGVNCCPSLTWRRTCVPHARESPTTQLP